jgi:exonuclease III
MKGNLEIINLPEKRLMLLNWTNHNTKVAVLNVYIPALTTNNQTKTENKIIEHLVTLQTNDYQTIIAGDLNDYEDFHLDRWSTYNRQSQHNAGFTRKLTHKNMIDTFRTEHPTKKSFSCWETYTDKTEGKTYHTRTRIDAIRIPSERRDWIQRAEVLEYYEIDSDHRIVLADLSIPIKTKQINQSVTMKPERLITKPLRKKENKLKLRQEISTHLQ